jgi:hypothetical protein
LLFVIIGLQVTGIRSHGELAAWDQHEFHAKAVINLLRSLRRRDRRKNYH